MDLESRAIKPCDLQTGNFAQAGMYGSNRGSTMAVLVDSNTRSQAAFVHLFVVIGAQRTGTNLLREILNTNEQIAMLGEVLMPSPAPAHWNNFCRKLPVRHLPTTYGEAESLLDQYFEFVEYRIRNHWEGNKKSDSHAFGVDIKYNQLTGIAPADCDPILSCPFIFFTFVVAELR
jgi:hypothetical protein